MPWVDQCPHRDDGAAPLVTKIETDSDQENSEEVKHKKFSKT